MSYQELRDRLDSVEVDSTSTGIKILKAGDFYVSPSQDSITVWNEGVPLWMLENDGTVAKYAGEQWFKVVDEKEIESITGYINFHVQKAIENLLNI